ncbi:23S rRNA (adenine(2503)-C(2))-methyltransferase RlmN [Balneolaceae bacterium ANBcel3]|nr:23S rRNA (adenine(2503)-C(2))-methyltransferase RlmN [Balneolaceae bacterium ANBcel3]
MDIRKISLADLDERLTEIDFNEDDRNIVRKAVYIDRVPAFNEIQELTPAQKSILSDIFSLQYNPADSLLKSGDGSYRLTLELSDSARAETVIIPEWENGLLKKCAISISSQIGCFFGCSFCATGQLGFHRNLTTGELLDQFHVANEVVSNELNTVPTHLYFMGMGEPLHNYRALSDALSIMKDPDFEGLPPSAITISTVGLYRQIQMLTRDHPEVRLAVSIHSADQKIRERIMPVSARLGLKHIREALRAYNRATGHPVTIQYLLLRGINDSTEQAETLISYLRGIHSEITLIMYNEIESSNNSRPNLEVLNQFKDILIQAGLKVDVRWCYGEDIQSGCGQLQPPVFNDRVHFSMRHPSP